MPFKSFLIVLILFALLLGSPEHSAAQDQAPVNSYTIQPGDTWTALAYHFQTPIGTLQEINGWTNRQRQPAIGATLTVPVGAATHETGRLTRGTGGLLQHAVGLNGNPWSIAIRAEMTHPYRPVLGRPLFQLGGTEPPRDWPAGMAALEVSHVPAVPGQALALRGTLLEPAEVKVQLDAHNWVAANNGRRFVAIGGTGAFLAPGDHELLLVPDNGPAWTQPWRFSPGSWTFQEITLTGSAAQIDQESIRRERERLEGIWSRVNLEPFWRDAFTRPIDSFLAVSSDYGARRSYNGGPYRTYHEGVDFSAYGGTPVLAPAAGRVALAETLYVRGGAVIIDHGLGVFSGYYHLSEVTARLGQEVVPGEIIGHVGTSGLSTGNHLHWDMLVGGLWIDGAAWLDADLACWIRAGWGEPCLDD